MEILPTLTAEEPAVQYPQARSAEAQIVSTLGSDSRPLTLRQLHLRTGIPLPELREITGGLCGSRSISRLNTVVESFCLTTLD